MKPSSRPRWRRALRAIALVGVAAIGATAAVGAAHATSEDDAVPLTELSTGLSSLVPTVESFGPAVLSDGRRLSVGIDVVNASVVDGATADGLWMEMKLTRQPLGTPERVAAFHESPQEYSSRSVATAPVGVDADENTGSMGAGDTARVALGAPAADLPLPADDWGVYGVSVYLHDSTDTVLVDAMVVTWVDTDLPTLPVSVIATASGSPARIDAIVSAANHPAVTVLVDPTAVEYNSDAQRSLIGREVYRLPAHHPDVTSLARAGDTSLLARASELSLQHPAPSLRSLPWLGVVAGLDAPTVTALREYGAVGAMVEPRYGDADLGRESSGDIAASVAEVPIAGTSETLPVVTPHTGLSEILSSFRPTHAATPARVVAEAALLAGAAQGADGVVASAGSSWVVDGDGTSPALAALFSAPWVEAVPLSTVLSETPRELVPVPEAGDHEADIAASDLDLLNQRLQQVERLAGTTPMPSALMEPANDAVLRAVSLHGRSDPASRNANIRMALDRTSATLDSVSIATGSALNLVAASGNVPITVRNDLPVDTTVTVTVLTASPYIDVVDRPTITVPAESEATALVPVTAVSSANVNVSVELRDSEDEAVTPPQALEIRVRADWGNAATGVFTVALVLLLIAGLVRTIRRGRKDTRTGPGPQAKRAEPAPVVKP